MGSNTIQGWTFEARAGVILARKNTPVESDWGHMPIKAPVAPMWLAPFALAVGHPGRGSTVVVLCPQRLGRAMGNAPARDLLGEECAYGLKLAAGAAPARTFDWPAGWPRPE